MANDFYAEWFSRPRPQPLSPQEIWDRNTNDMRRMAQSPFGIELAEKFQIPEVDEAEAAFKAVVCKISDPELKNEIDMAAGKISQAYQILGFCAGRFSQDSRASLI